MVGQHWGKHSGIIPPGYMCCKCYPTCLPYIVTKNVIRYDTPVIACPTKDNVRINVNINLMFRVQEDEESILKFIYKLGAARLDDILQVEIDEAVRNFVRSIQHDQVLDLKSEMASKMIAELNKKFQSFGVLFENASISSINLPTVIEDAFSDATKYDIRLQNQLKKNQNDRLMIENEQNQKLTELKKENMKKIQEIKGSRDRALLERDEQIVSTETLHDVQIIEAEEKANLLIIKAQNDKVIAENLSGKQVATIISSARSEAFTAKTKVDQLERTKGIEAEAKFYCLGLHAESIKTESKSESAVSESMKKKRDFEYSMAKTEVLESLAKNGHLIFGGDNGDALLKEISDSIK